MYKQDASRFAKIFKDPVYDYVEIDNDICDKIIDSKYFQRLKRIEQTSMRCLYPSARHDRFIHSIGVYHLAKIVIETLRKNEKPKGFTEQSSIDDNIKDNIFFAFEMAALLHDIGHAPFSHTLEDYFKIVYTRDDNGTGVASSQIEDIFVQEAKNINSKNSFDDIQSFIDDFKKSKPNPHEIVSCIIIFRQFNEIIKFLADSRGVKVDLLFVARCILGATYQNTGIQNNDYKNCIIQLLNSAIDVDKLDYIARDSSVSGFANTLVDTKRLLASLLLVYYTDKEGNNKLCLAFKKTAISVIQNVVTSRNSLYTWIYSHHKVLYESNLIRKAIDLIAEKQVTAPDGMDKELFISKYFSPESIEDNLVCDDKIWNLFIKHTDISEVNEITERNSQYKAIWKSFAEFQAYFNDGKTPTALEDYSLQRMNEFLNDKDADWDDFTKYLNEFRPREMQFRVVKANLKLANIKPREIMIYINERLYPFDEIFNNIYQKMEIPPFFYVYCPKDTKNKLNDIPESSKRKLKYDFIDYIKKYKEFKFLP